MGGCCIAPSPLCFERESSIVCPSSILHAGLEDVAQVLQVLVHAVDFVDLAAADGGPPLEEIEFEFPELELKLELELEFEFELEPDRATGLGVRGLWGAGRGLIRFLWRFGLIT